MVLMVQVNTSVQMIFQTHASKRLVNRFDCLKKSNAYLFTKQK